MRIDLAANTCNSPSLIAVNVAFSKWSHWVVVCIEGMLQCSASISLARRADPEYADGVVTRAGAGNRGLFIT